MKNRQTVKMAAAVGVLVVAVGAYFGMTLWNKAETEKEEAENASIELLDMGADDITGFSYQYEGETIAFVKEDGTWYLDSDRDFPVTQSSIEGKLSSVASTTASRKIEISEDNLADYGLDEPVNTITITDSEGNETVLEIGDQNGTSSEYYCRFNESDQVYMISSSLNSMMSFDIYTIVDMEDFPSFDMDSIKEFTVDDGSSVRSLDADDDYSAYSAASGMYYTQHIDYNAEDLSVYGLDDPQYTVTIKYLEESEEESTDSTAASGETQASDESGETTAETEETEETYDEADLTTLVLYIGAATDSGYYVRLEGSNEVNMLSTDNVESLIAEPKEAQSESETETEAQTDAESDTETAVETEG